MHRIAPFFVFYSIDNTATDWRWAMSHSNTPPVSKQAQLTTLPSYLRSLTRPRGRQISCLGTTPSIQLSVSAADRAPHCRTVLQNWKDKTTKASPSSNISWNTRQDFLRIPCLWGAALETERRWSSKVILKSNVTPNISRSSHSFSTVLPIVNVSDCIGIHCMWPEDYHSLSLTRIFLDNCSHIKMQEPSIWAKGCVLDNCVC